MLLLSIPTALSFPEGEMLDVHRWFVCAVCLLSVLLLTQGVAQATSCTGTHACEANTAKKIGTDSCNGDQACYFNSGNPIGDKSCNEKSVCAHNTEPIGNHSCTGWGACADNGGRIGDGSCNGEAACDRNNEPV